MNFLASFLLRVRMAVVVLHAASLLGAVSAQMSLREWVRRSDELRSALRTDDAADAAKVFVGVLFAHGDSMPIGLDFIGSDREVLIHILQRSRDGSERLHVLALLLWDSRGAAAESASLRGLLGRRDVSDSERMLRLAVVAEMSGSGNREVARAILDGMNADSWGNTESRRQALLVLGWMATDGSLVEVLPGLLESEGVLSDLDARALASGLCLRPEIELAGLAGIRVELKQLLGVYWNRISDRFSTEGLEIVSEEKPALIGIAEAWWVWIRY